MSTRSTLAILTLAIPLTLSTASGQYYNEETGRYGLPNPNTRIAIPDYRPTWERWRENDDESAFRVRESRTAGSVSVEQLRRPLKGKARDLIAKAEKLIRDGKDATRVLKQALEIPEAQPFAYVILGTEHLKQGKLEEALVEMEQAAQLLPGNAANLNNLAFALGKKGQSERALEVARKALQLDPGSPKTRYIVACLLFDKGQIAEGTYHLRLAATEIPAAKRLLEAMTAHWEAKKNPPPSANPARSLRRSQDRVED